MKFIKKHIEERKQKYCNLVNVRREGAEIRTHYSEYINYLDPAHKKQLISFFESVIRELQDEDR